MDLSIKQAGHSAGNDGIAAVITLAYRHPQAMHPAPVKLLELLACFNCELIHYGVLCDTFDDEDQPSWLKGITATRDTFSKAIQPLLDYSHDYSLL